MIDHEHRSARKNQICSLRLSCSVQAGASLHLHLLSSIYSACLQVMTSLFPHGCHIHRGIVGNRGHCASGGFDCADPNVQRKFTMLIARLKLEQVFKAFIRDLVKLCTDNPITAEASDDSAAADLAEGSSRGDRMYLADKVTCLYIIRDGILRARLGQEIIKETT